MSTIYGNSISIMSQPVTETIVPMLTNVNASTSITVKAMCYHDGYWYGAANDSANNLYKIYGATMDNLTIVKLASNRAFPIKGMVCDGTRVWICNGTGSYSGRTLIFQTVANFRSSNTNYNYTTINASSYSYEDICHVNDATSGSCVFVAGTINNQVGITSLINNSTSAIYRNYTITGSFIGCCDFNNVPCFISNTGTLGSITNIANGTLSMKTNKVYQNAKKIKQLGDYLCILRVNDDGVYLCKLTSPLDSAPVEIKLSNKQYTIIGMEHAGDSYIVVGTGEDGTVIWESADLVKFKEKKILLNGYTPRAIATDTASICFLGDKETSVEKVLVNFGKKNSQPTIYFAQEGETFNISTTKGTEIGPITLLDENGKPWANSVETVARLGYDVSDLGLMATDKLKLEVKGTDYKVYLLLQANTDFSEPLPVKLVFRANGEYNYSKSRTLFYITSIPETSTYLINENPTVDESLNVIVDFTDASGNLYNILDIYLNDDGSPGLTYTAGLQGSVTAYDGTQGIWTDEQYRTITFSGTIPTELLTWLQANATLQ